MITPTSRQPHQQGGGRSVAAGSALLGLALVGLLAGCGSTTTPTSAPSQTSTPASSQAYGGYPAFLPRNTVTGGFQHRIVNASAHNPALATQGDTVRVHVGGTSVLATLSGPDVPVAGQQVQADASPATWHVVLKGASAPLRLNPATFQAVDESGAVYNLTAQGHVPAVVKPGQVVRFDLFSPGFAVGEGRMRWIPTGHLAPVEWDYTVETD